MAHDPMSSVQLPLHWKLEPLEKLAKEFISGGTHSGGAYGDGVVFKLAPTSSGWRETVLHSFRGFGALPQAPVIFDLAGNLYGTTTSGSKNNGLAFKLTP